MTEIEVVATYDPSAPKFANIFAQTIFLMYLYDASEVQIQYKNEIQNTISIDKVQRV